MLAWNAAISKLGKKYEGTPNEKFWQERCVSFAWRACKWKTCLYRACPACCSESALRSHESRCINRNDAGSIPTSASPKPSGFSRTLLFKVWNSFALLFQIVCYRRGLIHWRREDQANVADHPLPAPMGKLECDSVCAHRNLCIYVKRIFISSFDWFVARLNFVGVSF